MSTEKVPTQIRRDQIAQAVLRLISRQGLKGLNMARVAAEIGLVPSALYRHFRGKEEMVDAALDVIRLRLLGNVDAVCNETENALERLRLLLERQLEMIRDNQAIPRIIFSEEVSAGHSDRKKKVYHLVRTFLSKVEAIVRVGQKTGQIRKKFEPKMVSVLFLGLFQPAAVLWYLSDGRYDVSRHIHQAWPIFMEAIKGEQPLPARENVVVKNTIKKMEGKAMHDKQALCDRIRSLYPEIGECGIEVKANFDETKKVWVVDLKKEGHQLKTFLEPLDADSCIEGKQCVSLGLQIAQLVANIKSA